MNKLTLGMIINLLYVIITLFSLIIYTQIFYFHQSIFFKIGPSKTLRYMNIFIDSFPRYFLLLISIIIDRSFGLYRYLKVYPNIIYFFKPDTKVIVGFKLRDCMTITLCYIICESISAWFFISTITLQVDILMLMCLYYIFLGSIISFVLLRSKEFMIQSEYEGIDITDFEFDSNKDEIAKEFHDTEEEKKTEFKVIIKKKKKEEVGNNEVDREQTEDLVENLIGNEE